LALYVYNIIVKLFNYFLLNNYSIIIFTIFVNKEKLIIYLIKYILYMEYNLLKNDTIITLIIIMCISFVSTIYIILGLFINYQLDEYLYENKHKYFSEEYVKNTPMYILIFNMSFTFSVLMIIAFFIKSMFDIIVVPNINIFKYNNIYELYTGSALVIVLVTFSQALNKQYKDIKMKLSGRIY
jgi:hypothetical protein